MNQRDAQWRREQPPYDDVSRYPGDHQTGEDYSGSGRVDHGALRGARPWGGGYGKRYGDRPHGEHGGMGSRSGESGNDGGYLWPDHEAGYDDPLDPDYRQWRDEQMRALDRDYRDWRAERYKKFSEEFVQWRGSRGGSSGSDSTSAGSSLPSSQTSGDGTGSKLK